MKEKLIKIYRKLPLNFREKVKNIIKINKDSKSENAYDKLFNTLKKYDVISFDIFDTLVTRAIYSPNDVFELLSIYFDDKNFKSNRKTAEENARKKAQHDVNIDEIYIEYANLCNKKINDVQKIKKCEIELEKDIIISRTEMVKMLTELRQLNKIIILTSDMYLKKDTIEGILKNCGYNNLYNEFYLSNDINKRKDTKTMWEYLKEKYTNKKMIHIGDNELSDVLYPREFGIDTLKIDSSKELFEKSLLYPYLSSTIDSRTISDSIYLGLLINKKIFNSPFSDFYINDIDVFAYVFHAPLITLFIQYIIDSNCDNLAFLAREGYYLSKLYKDYCKINNIKTKKYFYFLASRKATNSASLFNENDIRDFLNRDYNGSINNFIYNNFNLNIGDNTNIKLPEDIDVVLRVLKNYSKQILKNSKNERNNYIKYIETLIPNYKTKRINLIDLGYSGSIQYNLSKMLKKNFDGYYLTNSSSVKKYNNMSKLNFLFDINENKEYEKIYHYSLLLEYFLTAPYGQLQKFNNENKKPIPVYNNEFIDENKAKNIDKIYLSICEYFEDIKKFKKYIKYNPSKGIICKNYIGIVESGIISIKVKDLFEFEDAYCSDKARNVFKIISRY